MWYVLGFILAILGSILQGFYASKMWMWFMVPLGLPSISVAHAMGIAMVCGMMISSGSTKKIKNGEDMCSYALAAAVTMTIMFGIAAIINYFM
ncbi:MAG: hypothetical protein IKI94_08925 [Ruminococcus sp.]|nr:hypothetical protein [Ruminococcus sp.]